MCVCRRVRRRFWLDIPRVAAAHRRISTASLKLRQDATTSSRAVGDRELSANAGAGAVVAALQSHMPLSEAVEHGCVSFAVSRSPARFTAERLFPRCAAAEDNKWAVVS